MECYLCPRRCGGLREADRGEGICASPAAVRVARAALHFGEEPCINGSSGAGAVFFTGCALGCVFCQNQEISRGYGPGKILSVEELRELFLSLQDQGAECLDLVTGGQYIPWIAQALEGLSLKIPVVWNSSGYESVESLKRLEGLVQVYMPDFKYWKADLAARYSKAADYPAVAKAAIKEMYRQVGPYELDEKGVMEKGLLIRHLILPQQDLNAMDVMDFVAEEFPSGSVLFSLMSQYTPMPGLEEYPELLELLDPELNDRLIAYMEKLGLEGYCQELSAATTEQIPDFDLSGLDRT